MENINTLQLVTILVCVGTLVSFAFELFRGARRDCELARHQAEIMMILFMHEKRLFALDRGEFTRMSTDDLDRELDELKKKMDEGKENGN